MANVKTPAVGTGDTTPIVSTDVVTADSSNVQNVQLTSVAAGVLTRLGTSGSPLEVAIVGTVPISGAPTTVTANLGTLNGAALDASLQSILTQLNTNTTNVNVFRINGQAMNLGAGTIGTGTQRVVLATDQAQLTNALKVDPSGVTSPVSAAALPLPTGAATETTLAAVNTKLGGTLTVTGGGTPLDLTATGSLTGTGTVAITGMNAMSTVMAQITGGANATFAFEGTVDGTNWAVIPYVASNSPTTGWVTTTGTTSSTAIYEAQISGLVGVRINVNSYVSGTVGVAMRASNGMLTRPNVSIVGGVALLAGVASVGTVGLNAGTQIVGKVGIDHTTPGTTDAVTTELTTGTTTFCNTALTNTKTAVKAGAGKVHGWMIHNPSAATTFIQVWNVAIGSITVGTTAPTYVIPIPAGASANVFSEKGVTHSTEINIAATTTATGSTAPATAAVVSVFYV